MPGYHCTNCGEHYSRGTHGFHYYEEEPIQCDNCDGSLTMTLVNGELRGM